MKFREFLQENKEKHAVLAYGRMNPPTTGHEVLVNKVKDVADKVGGTHHIVLSHSQDKAKNPLSSKQKLKHAKRFFPKTNLSVASKEHPTIIDHAEKLHKQGVTHLHVVAGGDRVPEFHKLLHKYNGTQEGARYNFKKITVHQAGERDPDAEGVAGMSASKMRGHAAAGKFHQFKKGIPKHVPEHHAQELYNDVRKSMQVKEESESRIPKKEGQPDKSNKHSDLYTDEDPKGTIHGLKFATPEDAKASVSKIKSSGRSHAHKIQAAIAMEQRARVMGKTSAAGIYRSFINSMKEKTKNVNERFESILEEGVHDKGIFKAVFLVGGPGSGKDYVLKKTLDGHGLTEINSDKALEYLSSKDTSDKKDKVRSKAKDITEVKQKLAFDGRNGIIINGTGDDYEKIADIKKKLDAIGYESSMIMVNTADDVSANRNVERGQNGGRAVPENVRKQKWQAVQESRPKLAKLFGDNYVEFDNSEDLRQSPPETVKAKTEEMDEIFKQIQKFIGKPPKNEAAQDWVTGELSKKDTMPINKTIPHPESGGVDKAKEMGLEYYGFGRYGKNNKITMRVVHGSLVPVEKIEQRIETFKNKQKKVDVKTKPKKKINEQFQHFLNEDTYDNQNNSMVAVYGYTKDNGNVSTKSRTNSGLFKPTQKDTAAKKTLQPENQTVTREETEHSRPKITLTKIRESWGKKTESIDKGIESGLSMASAGENFSRGLTKTKAVKKPLEELTGDETGASIGAQKEDELKKNGISLTSFKKRNYV